MDSTTLNLIFSGVSAICAVISVAKCNEIKNIINNFNNQINIKGNQNTTGDITGGNKVSIGTYIDKNVTNDEDDIRKISNEVTSAAIVKNNEHRPEIHILDSAGKSIDNTKTHKIFMQRK